MIKRHLQNETRTVHLKGPRQSVQERPYNHGAVRKAIIRSESKEPNNKGQGGAEMERHHNHRVKEIKTMNDNDNTSKTAATTTQEAPKRTKANYDIVCGEILGHIKSNEGVHLNGLCDHFGTIKSDKKTVNPKGKWAFPVIYAAVNKLKSAGTIFATGAKKNQGLYLTAEGAKKNTPALTERTPRKKDASFVLEKKTAKGTWRASEGGPDRKPIEEAFKVASSVPGSEYRVMDNTGAEPKVLMTNEEPVKTEPAKPAKTEAVKTEPVKVAKK